MRKNTGRRAICSSSSVIERLQRKRRGPIAIRRGEGEISTTNGKEDEDDQERGEISAAEGREEEDEKKSNVIRERRRFSREMDRQLVPSIDFARIRRHAS